MKPKRPLVITIFVLALVVIFTCNLANATEQAVISFNDAEHQAVLIDSVLGVRDTTWEGWWPCFASDSSIVEYSDWVKNVKSFENTAEKESDSCYMYFFRPIITRREFVKMEIRPISWTIRNGSDIRALIIETPRLAIIVWKKVFVAFGEYDPLRGKKDIMDSH